jgi:hypothetical protein
MNRLQLLLGKLSEEGLEVAQRGLKAQQFGLGEVQPDQPFTNAQRIHHELDDLMASIEMLNDEFDLGYTPCRERIEAKKLKVTKFAELSRSLGMLS